ncbi:hypothetical protein H6G11_09375 [Cyanobacterium aponinum FACHB-4101]|uniref:DUF7682 family zinc-binding protein n=1 Tax=Cyanobacterium aponinum TaxID=379064 RepID=UPI0016803D32|nr:hypothetical protein [Cyanobacterium aponinum]MBD2394463.1 hypothetical protein [Cyanobacterium aponinum FACHB-4101]
MSRRKKKFACGHSGYGKVCHRCEQKNSFREQKRREKNAWQETFCNDPIDLSSLPKNVVLKARQIIKHIQNQTCYTNFRGKRLRHDRFIISIPVTRNYRLICRDYGSFVAPEAVVSHEDYNVCKPGR